MLAKQNAVRAAFRLGLAAIPKFLDTDMED